MIYIYCRWDWKKNIENEKQNKHVWSVLHDKNRNTKTKTLTNDSFGRVYCADLLLHNNITLFRLVTHIQLSEDLSFSTVKYFIKIYHN